MTITRTLVLRSAAALAVLMLASPSRPERPRLRPTRACARTRGQLQGVRRRQVLQPGRHASPEQRGRLHSLRQVGGHVPGEVGSKDTCKYVFKIAGENEDSTYVQVYSPIAKEVLEKPRIHS